MSDHSPKLPARQDNFVLRLPLPWLQSRAMRGPAFTMASLVTWCANGDNTFNPRVWQIASRSGLTTRQTKTHIRILENQGHIYRSQRIRRAPTRTTILDQYFDLLYGDDTKYLELPVQTAQLLGHEQAQVSILARCVAASLYNEIQLQARIRDRNSNGDELELPNPVDPCRIARELKTQRCRINQALSILRSCGEIPHDPETNETTH